MLHMPTFPNDWPEGCPPKHAQPPAHDFHRIVKADPPDAESFLSYREMGKPDRGQPCSAAGLSVFTEKADAQHYQAKFPFIGELIATGSVNATHGLWAPEARKVPGGSSHSSWWVCENIIPDKRAALFVIE
jgi:hypothetical protein